MAIKTRLIILISIVLVVAFTLVGFTTYSLMQNYLFNQARNQLKSAADPIAETLYLRGTITTQEIAHIAPGMYVAIDNSQGDTLYELLAAYGPGGEKEFTPRLNPRVFKSLSLGHQQNEFVVEPSQEPFGPNFLVMLLPILNGYVLVLGLPVASIQTALHRLLVIEVIVGLFSLLLALTLGYLLLNVGLSPLKKLLETIKIIKAGNISQRARIGPPYSEISEIATAFNEMLDVIEASIKDRDRFSSELKKAQEKTKKFLADASHELRTPLQALLAYSELIETQQLIGSDLTRAVSGIAKESQRLKVLVNDLFLLARLDEEAPIERSIVDLKNLLDQAIEVARLSGFKWPINVVKLDEVSIIGDEIRLRQVIDNLFNNVRVHNPEGASIYVSLEKASSYVILTISDDGKGFNEGDIDKVFDRFFRGSNERSTTQGSYGLGLAIVYSIVKAHGGSVRAFNGGISKGASVEITLPLRGST